MLVNRIRDSITEQQLDTEVEARREQISFPAYVQGELYMQLELLLVIEGNRFLTREYLAGRLNATCVQLIDHAWRQNARPSVTDFRYDIATQQALAVQSMNTLQFGGAYQLGSKMRSSIAAWEVLATELSIRTFCMPDIVIKRHLQDAEQVLELLDAPADSMRAFQEMKGRTLSDLYCAQRANASSSDSLNRAA
ncbi:hypothetical protein MRB53_038259 [Persea americana]|nr:hypothetical protein MRB53_038259 [Persea americana]